MLMKRSGITEGKRIGLTQAVTAFMLVLFVITLAVTVTLHFRQLYYFDMKYLNISEISGFGEEEIRANYDALIDYNSIFFTKELEFPTLPMSASGKFHFEEVKVIFVAVKILLIVSAVASIPLIVILFKKKRFQFLKWASITLVVLPVLLGIFVFVGWDLFFVAFHLLFFNNDAWLFSPQTDPVILMLPDTFFLHCAVMILALVFVGAGILFTLYKTLKKRQNNSVKKSA
jgi:integral membrane protein TIGR01906